MPKRLAKFEGVPSNDNGLKEMPRVGIPEALPQQPKRTSAEKLKQMRERITHKREEAGKQELHRALIEATSHEFDARAKQQEAQRNQKTRDAVLNDAAKKFGIGTSTFLELSDKYPLEASTGSFLSRAKNAMLRFAGNAWAGHELELNRLIERYQKTLPQTTYEDAVSSDIQLGQDYNRIKAKKGKEAAREYVKDIAYDRTQKYGSARGNEDKNTQIGSVNPDAQDTLTMDAATSAKRIRRSAGMSNFNSELTDALEAYDVEEAKRSGITRESIKAEAKTIDSEAIQKALEAKRDNVEALKLAAKEFQLAEKVRFLKTLSPKATAEIIGVLTGAKRPESNNDTPNAAAKLFAEIGEELVRLRFKAREAAGLTDDETRRLQLLEARNNTVTDIVNREVEQKNFIAAIGESGKELSRQRELAERGATSPQPSREEAQAMIKQRGYELRNEAAKKKEIVNKDTTDDDTVTPSKPKRFAQPADTAKRTKSARNVA